MAFSLPQKFLDKEILVEFNEEMPALFGRILQFNENWIQFESDNFLYVIPWTSICNLRISVKQQIPEEE